MQNSSQGEAAGRARTGLTSLSHWTTYEKFNVSFQRIAEGWTQVNPDKAASAVGHILRAELNAAGEKPLPGRLFLVGNMGYVGTERIAGTLKNLEEALALSGELRIKRSSQSLAGTYTVAEQTVEDVPIYGAQLTLHMDAEGTAYALVGTPAPRGLKVSASPKKIQPKEAADVVTSALETKAEELEKCSYEEIFLPVDEQLLPCYRIRASARKPFGDWYGFVGFDGNLLALFNVASSAKAQGYKVNPLRSPQLEPLPLSDLVDPASWLAGQRSEVWGANGKRVPSHNGAFLFNPNQEEFDEPQLYYFLQFCRSAAEAIAQTKLTSLLQHEQKFNPMKGTVHVPEADDNAFYKPETEQLYFGDTTSDDPRHYSSRSLDIVLHEFGHAISDSICGLGRASANNSSRAMSEGYSDYFAATLLNDPVIGEYFFPANSRTCANPLKFPRGFAGEEHDVGTVWAGLLWDLRNERTIGPNAADSIMLQSLSYLGPWRTIPQGIDALLQADRVLFPDPGVRKGRHEDAIRAAFINRRS